MKSKGSRQRNKSTRESLGSSQLQQEKLSPQRGGWALRPASQPLGAEKFGKIQEERGKICCREEWDGRRRFKRRILWKSFSMWYCITHSCFRTPLNTHVFLFNAFGVRLDVLFFVVFVFHVKTILEAGRTHILYFD